MGDELDELSDAHLFMIDQMKPDDASRIDFVEDVIHGVYQGNRRDDE